MIARIKRWLGFGRTAAAPVVVEEALAVEAPAPVVVPMVMLSVERQGGATGASKGCQMQSATPGPGLVRSHGATPM